MRKSKPKKRYLLPDPKFKDTLVTKFVNSLMYDGKKSILKMPGRYLPDFF